MITVIQRVSKAKVIIDNKVYSQIEKGIVILLGICQNDTEKDVVKLVEKIVNLRIMADNQDRMNLSLKDANCQVLVVSQFTLCSNLKSGRRPDFNKVMAPKPAWHLYDLFAKQLQFHLRTVATGSFGARMAVELINDGPVTFILDSNQI